MTVRGAELPRVHPINVGVVDGGLYAFLLPSPKRTDLERDGRFALHTHQDPAAPDEFSIRGRAQRRRGPGHPGGRGRRVVLRGGRHATCSSSCPSSRRCLASAGPTSGRRATAAGARRQAPDRKRPFVRKVQHAILRIGAMFRAPTPDSPPPPRRRSRAVPGRPVSTAQVQVGPDAATWRRVDEATPASPCTVNGPGRVARRRHRRGRPGFVGLARRRDDRHHDQRQPRRRQLRPGLRAGLRQHDGRRHAGLHLRPGGRRSRTRRVDERRPRVRPQPGRRIHAVRGQHPRGLHDHPGADQRPR